MSREILVLISDRRPSTNAKTAGIYRYAKNVGWKVLVIDAPATERNARALLELWKPDGCIIESGRTGKPPVRLPTSGVRTVFLDTDRRHLPKGAAYVSHDSEADGRLAAKELIATGCTAFAFIAYPGELFWSREREAAFIKTLRLNGISRCSRFHPHSTAQAQAELSREISDFVAALKPGCGIFAANDYLADIVVSVARRLGRNVPQDISVIGVDNNESLCTHSTPALSSIAPDFELGGYLAAELLDEMFRNGARASRPNAVFGPIAVVRRSSTAFPSAYGGLALKITTAIRDSEGRLPPGKIIASLSCSRRTAEQHFRKATGKPILEAINEMRFEKACLLLRQRLPISDIALRTGYSSTIAFDRFFKSRCGLTPCKWRERRAENLRT